MPKYTESPPSTIPDSRWFKRIANEMAENNRLQRKMFKLRGNMAKVDPTNQDDNAGS